MRKMIDILLKAFCAPLIIPEMHAFVQSKAVRHDNKKIEFEPGHFKVFGDLLKRMGLE